MDPQWLLVPSMNHHRGLRGSQRGMKSVGRCLPPFPLLAPVPPVSPKRLGLVPQFINTSTFAARSFWPRRGASDEHTLQGSVRSKQRSLGRKEPPPGGLRRFSVLASLLLSHSPAVGDA